MEREVSKVVVVVAGRTGSSHTQLSQSTTAIYLQYKCTAPAAVLSVCFDAAIWPKFLLTLEDGGRQGGGYLCQCLCQVYDVLFQLNFLGKYLRSSVFKLCSVC